MNTEDETFNRLRRPTLREMARLVSEHASIVGSDGEMAEFIELHNWTLQEYINEYYTLTDNLKSKIGI